MLVASRLYKAGITRPWTRHVQPCHYNITDTTNAQVAWLSKFAETNLDWKKLKNKRYNDFLKALDSSGRVRELMNQHHTVQHRKTRATEKLGDLWQHYRELQEILSNSSRSEKWMQLTAIANQTFRDPWLAKKMPQSCIHQLSHQVKSEVENKWVVYFHRLQGRYKAVRQWWP